MTEPEEPQITAAQELANVLQAHRVKISDQQPAPQPTGIMAKLKNLWA